MNSNYRVFEQVYQWTLNKYSQKRKMSHVTENIIKEVIRGQFSLAVSQCVLFTYSMHGPYWSKAMIDDLLSNDMYLSVSVSNLLLIRDAIMKELRSRL